MRALVQNSWIFRRENTSVFILAVLLSIYLLSAFLTDNWELASFNSLMSIFVRSVALALTAVGQTFVILVASIDLSVANLISVTAVLASVIMNGDSSMIIPAIAAAILVGAVVGLLNGLIITKLKVNPFIATLGMALLLQGLLSSAFSNFAGSVSPDFQSLAYGTFFGLPVSAFLMLGLYIIAWLVLRHTKFGANVYSVGGNPDAARAAGIKDNRVVIWAHIISSLCATLAGLYLAARLRSGAPWIGRDGVYDLESIAVVVIGGTLLAGGRGGVWGTLVGVLIFSFLDSLFNVLGVDAFLKQVLRGALIVAAVAISAYRTKGHVS